MASTPTGASTGLVAGGGGTTDLPGAARKRVPAALARFLGSPWAVLAVLALAVGLRGWGLADWSLWEDEETTIYFSQQPFKPFPRFFPVFFLLLHELYQVTGVSVAVGRALAAAIGVGGVALVYAWARRFASPAVGLLAALFLAVNLGHLFWSQSIRYFGLLFALQVLSAYWFLLGFERGQFRYLLLSNVAFALALLTHFSAVLLMPAYVVYLFFMVCGRQTGGAYNLRGYLVFGAAQGVVLGLMAMQFVRFHGVLSGMVLASARDPVHVLVTAVAYFGPVVALALPAPLVTGGVQRRMALFFVICGVVPLLELLVIAGLKLSNVTWYYGFFALAGFTVAAAITLDSLYRSGWRWMARAGVAATVLYAVVLLAGYYTTMYGDRPRWQDAAAYLSGAAHVRPEADDNPAIYANVPGVVAFYLGVSPGETMNHPLVRMLPDKPPAALPAHEQWFVVESGHATPAVEGWLAAHCEKRAEFVARTGPRDRSVRVFHYAGAGTISLRPIETNALRWR